MYIEVRNINGTGDNLPPRGYSSWLDYCTRNFILPEVSIPCSNFACDNQAEVGGHVKLVDSNDRRWFITPLCKKCNAKSDSYYVDESKLEPVR